MRFRLYALCSALSLLLLCAAASGSSPGDCDPEPVDVFCDSDADCGAGQVCNVFQFCVDTFVELQVAGESFAPGETVHFTVDPNGLPIELGGAGGVAPWTVERWSGQGDTWVPLRTGVQYGCRTTGCVSGVPVEVCMDPGPAWCDEPDGPFTDSWDGTHWAGSDEPCGAGTVTILRRVTAGPGSYRLVLRYGDDPEPGSAAPTTCAAQTQTAIVPFVIR